MNHISLKDPDFSNNCTLTDAHCIPPPARIPQQLTAATCNDEADPDFSFEPATPVKGRLPDTPTRFSKNCRVVQASIPFEVLQGTTEKRRLLLVVSNSGFTIVDMANEQLLAEEITNEGQLGSVRVLSGGRDTVAHIVGFSGSHLTDISIQFNANGVIQINRNAFVDITRVIFDIEPFYEKLDSTPYLAVLVADTGAARPNALRSYKLGSANTFKTPDREYKYV